MENNKIETENVNVKSIIHYFYKHLSVIAIILSLVSIIVSSMALTNANKPHRTFHANNQNSIRYEKPNNFPNDDFNNKFANRPNNDFNNRSKNNFDNKGNNTFGNRSNNNFNDKDFQNRPNYNKKPNMPLDRDNGPRTMPEVSPDKPHQNQSSETRSNPNNNQIPQ